MAGDNRGAIGCALLFIIIVSACLATCYARIDSYMRNIEAENKAWLEEKHRRDPTTNPEEGNKSPWIERETGDSKPF